MPLTRTQIESWNPASLTSIADAWTAMGNSVEALFDRYVDAVTKTGSDYWEGVTAEAAQLRAESDRKAARHVVDQIHALADRARQGYYEIDSPLQRTRSALLGAQTDCFGVSESLVVSAGAPPISEQRAAQMLYWQNEINDAARATKAADDAVKSALLSAREGLRLVFTSAATLGGDQGQSDANALVTDPAGLSPEQQGRIVEAGRLTPEQLDALRAGETATIPASQMEYLEQLGRAFDGKSVQEISDIVDQLPADTKTGVADALQILSNENVTATVVGDKDIPTNGGFDRLPDSIRESLTREDLVVYGFDLTGSTPPPSIELNGVADNQAIAQIVAAGSEEYQAGTTLDSHLLDVGRQYLDAQVQHEQNPDRAFEFFIIDGDATRQAQITEDIFEAVSPEKIAIHDAVTNPDHGQDFIRDTLSHNWSDDGRAAASMFSFDSADSVVADPGDNVDVATAERTGAIMSAVGEAIATDDWELLRNVPEADGQSVGQLNPQLMQTLSHSMSPYIPDLAGMQSDDRPGFDIDWIDPSGVGKYDGSAQVFALMNTDDTAGTFFTERTQGEILASEGRYAENPRDPYAGQHMTVAGTLHGLTDKGLMLAMGDQYEDQADQAQAAYDRKSAAFDRLMTLGTGGVGELPGGGYIRTMIELVGAPLKETFTGPEPVGAQQATLSGFDRHRDFYNVLAATPELPPEVTYGFEKELDANGSLLPYTNNKVAHTAFETMFNRLGNPADGNSTRMSDAYRQVILNDG